MGWGAADDDGRRTKAAEGATNSGHTIRKQAESSDPVNTISAIVVASHFVVAAAAVRALLSIYRH